MWVDVATLVLSGLAMLAGYTVGLVSLVLWLTGKFRFLEKLIYREMHKHRDEDDEQFRQHDLAIQRLETKVFGYTEAPVRGRYGRSSDHDD